jgi:hypothetical protein
VGQVGRVAPVAYRILFNGSEPSVGAHQGAVGIDESRMTMDAWSMSRVNPGSTAAWFSYLHLDFRKKAWK